jgi:hypothetical protein
VKRYEGWKNKDIGSLKKWGGGWGGFKNFMDNKEELELFSRHKGRYFIFLR